MCKSGSIAEICSRIRENDSYRSALESLGASELRRGQIERRLSQALFGEYERLIKYVSDGALREYLSAFFLRHEFFIIKSLLGAVYGNKPAAYAPSELKSLLKKLPVDAAKLASAKTAQDFIYELRSTDFHSLLADAYAKRPTPFELERQLDLYYYMHLWKKREKLPDKHNREAMKNINGAEIDLLNIIWIYRLKKYYGFDGPRIYPCLIPVGLKLNGASLRRMADAGTVDELTDEIASGPYRDVFSPTGLNWPERAFAVAMRRICKSESRKRPESLSCLIGYISCKEMEINQIIKTIECVRYMVAPEAAFGYII